MVWKLLIDEFAGLFGTESLFANFDKRSLKEDLLKSGIDVRPEAWLSFCLAFSAFSAMMLSILAYYFSLDSMLSIAAFPFLAAALFLVLLKVPSYLKRKRAEGMERELSIALRGIVLMLKLEIPFERIFLSISGGGYGILGREFGRAHREIMEGGASVEEALQGMSDRVDSALAKRVLAQMALAYSHGHESAALSKLADELILLQKTKGREHSSKMALLGLVFIAVGCIVPALFAAYVIIGSSFLDLSFTPGNIYSAYLLLFPSVAAAMLLYIKEKTPTIISM